MAVSFKVPASPKRDIFVIDNFMGVDLTNTGANIEDTRSPNAENMVRYVPGKVRKRTGYEKDVIFGQDINVNYAIGTSSKEQEIIIGSDDTSQYIEIYKLIQTIKSKDGNPHDVYIEFDYISQEDFYVNVGVHKVDASEDWAHCSYIFQDAADRTEFHIALWSYLPQTIYIKNFSIMRGKDASYAWSPAPKYFVERESNDPVYGVHIAKTGTFEGNRVVNVNRALNTSDSFVTYTVSFGAWTDLYTIAGDMPAGVTAYIEFDYICTGDKARVGLNGNGYLYIEETSTMKHFSGSIPVNSIASKVQIGGVTSGLTATLQIRNFSLMFEVDESTYDWHPAPEDSGKEFPIGDIFLTGSKDYATSNSYDDATIATNSVMDKRFKIEDATSKVEGYTHISFDLHTASFNTDLDKVEVWLVDSQYIGYKLDEQSGHYKSKHFDIYKSPSNSTEYFTDIGVVYRFNSGNGACWTYISNIHVNEITPRSTYDISPKWYIYHIGKDFYLRASNSKDFTKVYSDANQHLSKSWQFNNKLFILDGKNIYSYAIGDETVTPIGEGEGYIPTLTIAKEPSGGGISYEPLNMLQPGFIEMFQSNGNPIYQLSFGNLDSTPVKVWVMNSSGGWDEKVEGVDFNVNRGAGFVDLYNAPSAPVLTGEDDVKILAYRTVPGYRERITNCTNGALFGVGGAEDRLFLTGNPDYPNWDFYSEQYDPTYFPDTGYSALGSEQSAIVGYAIVNNYLAAFKDGFDTSQSVFIREGDLIVDDNKVSQPAFKLINTLQGHGVVAPYAFAYLANEPVFLTKAGIYAITAQDITGEKYSQNRSFYLNGKLTKESNLEDAVATVFNDMYVLAVNNRLYILDGLQATRTDRSEPYSTRQYVGFYCTDVPAVCLWTDENALWFGTNDGKVCNFHTDIEALESYNDDGKEIYCCWETPDLDGKLFYKNKTFRYFAIRMMKALKTSVQLWSQKLGAWSFIKEDTASGILFDFDNIDFDNFSFSTDASEKVVHTKVRVKKVDKARFRVENGKLNEPFGLFDLALEYIESGNYKG